MPAQHLRPNVCHNTASLIDFQVPKVQWGDVGGLMGVKQGLKEAVEWPHLHPEALARLGAQPPKGGLPFSSSIQAGFVLTTYASCKIMTAVLQFPQLGCYSLLLLL